MSKIPPSPSSLAELVNDFERAGRCRVTETEEEVVVAEASYTDARAVHDEAVQHGLIVSAEDATDVQHDSLSEDLADFGPFKLFIKKPAPTINDAIILFTHAGLKHWLVTDDRPHTLIVAGLKAPIETYGVLLTTWSDREKFVPKVGVTNPRRIVRDLGSSGVLPDDLAPWLVRDVDALTIDSEPARIWARRSADYLIASIADEIKTDGSLVFRGPPLREFQRPEHVFDRGSVDDFRDLQGLVGWVYENSSEAETRRSLVSAELSSSGYGGNDLATMFPQCAAVLQGARIAHQMGLKKLSMDALKSLSDLRKAVSDEASKLAESVRQLAAAVTGAVFAGVGVIAARLTLAIDVPAFRWVMMVLALVLLLYVTAVILSGWQFLKIQQQLRTRWRKRLYRYLSDEEYEDLVVRPSKAAETGFWTAALISAVVSFLLCAAIVFLGLSDISLYGSSPNEREFAPIVEPEADEAPAGEVAEPVEDAGATSDQ